MFYLSFETERMARNIIIATFSGMVDKREKTGSKK